MTSLHFLSMSAKQCFVQGILCAKALKRKQAIRLWNRCCVKVSKPNEKVPDETGEGLDTKINSINQVLELSGLQIRSTFNYYDKTIYMGIVNTEEDFAAKQGRKYDYKEIKYFDALVDFIVEEVVTPFEEDIPESLGVPLVDAQNLATEVGLRITEASMLIQQWHRDMWLNIIKKHGHTTTVTFGVRALLELATASKWAMERQSGAIRVKKQEKEEVEVIDSEMEVDDEIHPA